MHRVDGSGHVAGMFTEGDPGLGVAPTQVTDDWLNAVQEEIVAVITGTGASLIKADNTQLYDAILKLIPKAYAVQISDANDATLADFNANTPVMLGKIYTSAGEIMYSNSLANAHAMLFSMVVNVASPASVAFTTYASDDETYLYIDGVLAYTFTSATGYAVQTHTASLAAGDHVIQLLHNNSGGTKSDLILQSFIDGTVVSFLRAAVS